MARPHTKERREDEEDRYVDGNGIMLVSLGGVEGMTGVEDMMTGVRGTTGAKKGAEATKNGSIRACHYIRIPGL